MALPLRKILIYTGGDFISKATYLFTLPILTHALAPNDMGLITYMAAATTLLLLVLGAGFDAAFTKIFFDKERDKRTLASTVLYFYMGISALCLSLLLPSDPAIILLDDSGYGPAIFWALIGVPLTLITNLSTYILRSEGRALTLASLNIGASALTATAIVVTILYLKLGAAGYFAATALATGSALLPRLWCVRRFIGFHFSLDVLRRLLRYGTPLVGAGFAYWVIGMSDRLLLGRFADLDAVGIYGVGAIASSIMGLAVASFSQAWWPHAVRRHNEDPDAAVREFADGLRLVLLAFGTLAVGIAAFAPEIVTVVAPLEFRAAAWVMAPLALGGVAYASTHITHLGISLTDRTHLLTYSAWGAATICVVLQIVLIPRMGALGAALATAAAYLALTALYHFNSRRFLPIPYRRRRLALVVIVMLAFISASHLLPDGLIPALTVKPLYVATFVWIVWLCGLSAPERAIIGRRLATAIGRHNPRVNDN